jgi:hypothetical protein
MQQHVCLSGTSAYICHTIRLHFPEDGSQYKTVTIVTTQNSKHGRVYKLFRAKDNFILTMFVYTIASIFIVRLILLREVCLFYVSHTFRMLHSKIIFR